MFGDRFLPYDRGNSPFSDLSKTDLELLIKDLESD